MPTRPTAKIHVVVPPDLKGWLELRARGEDRTLSGFCLHILEEYRARGTQGTDRIGKRRQAPDPHLEGSRAAEGASSSSPKEPSAVEFEVRRFQSYLGHRLLVDKKLRDPWVCLLVRGLKWSVPEVAEMLHVTERSVYRMVKGEQTKRGPRNKPRPRPDLPRRGA
jgi:hypothetical protein